MSIHISLITTYIRNILEVVILKLEWMAKSRFITSIFIIMEGIFIPSEFYKIKELNGMERDVLALYKYYTENGKTKCCNLNNTQIAEFLNVSTRYLRMVKTHLKKLGYIRTDGGIKVIYLGVQVGSTVPTQVGSTVPTIQDVQVGSTVPQVGSTVPTDRKHSSYQVGSTVPIKQEAQFPHKKEKEEKKENKEEKRWMTNIKLLLKELPQDFHTKEIVNHIKETYMNRLNEVDFTQGSTLKDCLIRIRKELNDKFHIDYKEEQTVKEKPKSNTIDVI